MSATVANLQTELSNMVNCDFMKHVYDYPEPEAVGEYTELCDINEFLADKKEHLINSVAAAVAQEYPFSSCSNIGGTNLRDPIKLSITLKKTIPVNRITRIEVIHKGGTLAFTFYPENLNPKKSKPLAIAMGISYLEEQQLLRGSDLSAVIDIVKSLA